MGTGVCRVCGGSGPTPPSESMLIHQTTVTLNNNDFIAAANGSVELAGAPGLNKRITNVTGVIDANAVVGPYTFDASASIALGCTNSLTTAAYADSLQFLFGGDGEVANSILTPGHDYIDGGVIKANYWDASQNDNLPLNMLFFNNSAPLTGGDAANVTIVAALFYVFDRSTGLFLTTQESGWNQTTRSFS